MTTETEQKSFWAEAFDRKNRLEIVRCVAWTGAFCLTVFGLRKLLS